MIAGINITPMVDVVLVLLVIMMVSANYIVSQSIKVELPKVGSSDGAVPKVTQITIQSDGSLRLGEDAITADALRTELARRGKAEPDSSLVITADKATSHGDVMQVIDMAKTAGLHKFAINVAKAQ
jgi:biopolymer transport protein ExbD